MNDPAAASPAPPSGMLKRAGFLFLAAIPFAAAFAVDFPVCPCAGLLGIPCPGCGLTRATLALLHGHFAEAFALHPLVFVLAPAYIAALLGAVWDYLKGPRALLPSRAPSLRASFTSTRAFSIGAIVLLVLTLGVWSARFLGAFGGPVPVQSYAAWRASR